MEVDDAIGKGFGGEKLEADGAMATLDQGDAFADEDGDDVDAELVDFALVQEGGDDFAAAHHPDVFARLGAGAGRFAASTHMQVLVAARLLLLSANR